MSNTSMSPNITDDFNNDTVSTAEKFPLELLKQYWLFNAGNILIDIQLPICSGIGIPSNLASLLTLRKMKPVTSSIFLLMYLAIVDLMVLLYQQFFSILILNDGVRVYDVGCKFYYYVASTLLHLSVWIMLALNVERFIAVWFPLKVSNICTLRRSQITCFCISLTLFLLNIVFAVTAHEFQRPGGFWRCGIQQVYQPVMQKWAWFDSTIFLFIPWPTLLFCNVMIIVGLRKSMKKKEQLTNKSDQSGEAKRQQRSITVMLLMASVACFVLLTPNAVFFVYQNYWDVQADIQNYVTFVFTNAVVYFLSHLNNAINFWLYVLSGRRFRKVFIAVITCRSSEVAQKGTSSTGGTAVSTVSNASKGFENRAFTKKDENTL